jgi:hypothetical protein
MGKRNMGGFEYTLFRGIDGRSCQAGGMHYHWQVIPRYAGDVKEPGGGEWGTCRRGRGIPDDQWILGYNGN